MEVLRKGIPLAKRIYQGECHCCLALVRFAEQEGKATRDRRFVVVPCPDCGGEISAPSLGRFPGAAPERATQRPDAPVTSGAERGSVERPVSTEPDSPKTSGGTGDLERVFERCYSILSLLYCRYRSQLPGGRDGEKAVEIGETLNDLQRIGRGSGVRR